MHTSLYNKNALYIFGKTQRVDTFVTKHKSFIYSVLLECEQFVYFPSPLPMFIGAGYLFLLHVIINWHSHLRQTLYKRMSNKETGRSL